MRACIIARILCGAGYAVVFISLWKTARGWSAGWRYLSVCRLIGGARLAIGALALRRSTCGGFWRPRPRFRAETEPPSGPPIRRGSRRAFVPAACSPWHGAAGPRAGGRLCGASRERACEARPRAPRSPERVAPRRPRSDLSAPHLQRLPDRAAPPQDRL